MKHHTTDPSKRAEHIADMEERRNGYDYDWPTYWLETYRNVLKELVGNSTAAEAEVTDGYTPAARPACEE